MFPVASCCDHGKIIFQIFGKYFVVSLVTLSEMCWKKVQCALLNTEDVKQFVLYFKNIWIFKNISDPLNISPCLWTELVTRYLTGKERIELLQCGRLPLASLRRNSSPPVRSADTALDHAELTTLFWGRMTRLITPRSSPVYTSRRWHETGVTGSTVFIDLQISYNVVSLYFNCFAQTLSHTL